MTDIPFVDLSPLLDKNQALADHLASASPVVISSDDGLSCNDKKGRDPESDDVEHFIDAREFPWLPATRSQEHKLKTSPGGLKARDTVQIRHGSGFASPWFWPIVILIQSWLQFLCSSVLYSFGLAEPLLPQLCQSIREVRAQMFRHISIFFDLSTRPLQEDNIEADTISRLKSENEALWADNLKLEDQLTDSEAQRHNSNLNVLKHIHTIMCQDKDIEAFKSESAQLKSNLADHKETLAVWKAGQSEERSGLRAKLRAADEEKAVAEEDSLRSKRATEAFVRMLSLSKKSREDLDAKVQDL